ncbi:MAG: nucleoside monophosphate kinase [bacterium]|nr:nucleoside monophosphate kinase [bacterium]
MKKETFIFIGASGCGKGTQVELLKQELTKRDPKTPIFYLQTGQYFREFVKGTSRAAEIAREAQERGELLPGFLAMWLWSDIFIKNLTGEEHLIIDGSPRTRDEAEHLDVAFQFFKREHPTVVHIKVSPEWSATRMKERATREGRADDSDEGIKRRLSWFEREVLPTIERYRHDRDYRFIEVNGEQSIEAVYQEILGKVFSE